jgi:hypothetical protein
MDSELSRPQAVRALLEYSSPLTTLQRHLAPYPWDSDENLGFLTPSHVVGVLQRYLSDQLTAGDIEEWANLIESREDIGFDPHHSGPLADFVFDAANPDLDGEITLEWARIWIERLS